MPWGRAYGGLAPSKSASCESPETWVLHISPGRHAIEGTSLQDAAVTTAIGAGTAFALLTTLLIVLLIMGFIAAYVKRRQADRAVRGELALRDRATAAVVAVGVLKSGRETAQRGEG